MIISVKPNTKNTTIFKNKKNKKLKEKRIIKQLMKTSLNGNQWLRKFENPLKLITDKSKMLPLIISIKKYKLSNPLMIDWNLFKKLSYFHNNNFRKG